MPSDSIETDRAERLLQIGRSLTSNLDLESLLQEITLAARELTNSKYAALGILNSERDGLDRFITVGIDQAERAEIGELPHGHGVLGVLIDDPRPLRLARLSDHEHAFGFPPHHPPMETFLGVPILVDGTAYGNLYLTDKSDGEFDDRDEDAVITLAAWAAIAITNARSVRDHRLRAAIEGSENERKRWARELHDETLQSLGALNLLFASALRRGDKESLELAAREGSDLLRLEISNLRSLITELRPAALDEIGLMAALAGLTRRVSALADVEVELIDALESDESVPDDLQITIYRIVQEATSNAVKHASASRIWVSVMPKEDAIQVSVRDDGIGFDPEAPSEGFGLIGMRERVALAGGKIEFVSSKEGNTVVIANLPAKLAG